MVYGSKLQHPPLALCGYEDTLISTLSQEISIEVNKTSGQKQQTTTYFENYHAARSQKSQDTEKKRKKKGKQRE